VPGGGRCRGAPPFNWSRPVSANEGRYATKASLDWPNRRIAEHGTPTPSRQRMDAFTSSTSHVGTTAPVEGPSHVSTSHVERRHGEGSSLCLRVTPSPLSRAKSERHVERPANRTTDDCPRPSASDQAPAIPGRSRVQAPPSPERVNRSPMRETPYEGLRSILSHRCAVLSGDLSVARAAPGGYGTKTPCVSNSVLSPAVETSPSGPAS
jgi:hypothetical protein